MKRRIVVAVLAGLVALVSATVWAIVTSLGDVELVHDAVAVHASQFELRRARI